MLAMVFTVVAAFAAHTHRAAIYNLLNFYLAHPFTAIIGSLLLIYCPPLLDILPMYVTFLLLTPYILSVAVRRGWNRILIVSGIIWLLAQFGLRTWMHALVVHATGCIYRCRKRELSTFLPGRPSGFWLCGWEPNPRRGQTPSASCPVTSFHERGRLPLLSGRAPRLAGRSSHAGVARPGVGQMADRSAAHAEPFRLFVHDLLVAEISHPPGVGRAFLTLGKASLEVFCAHVFFVFVGLALLYGEVTELHGRYAIHPVNDYV
jgi:hypothetical protein